MSHVYRGIPYATKTSIIPGRLSIIFNADIIIYRVINEIHIGRGIIARTKINRKFFPLKLNLENEYPVINDRRLNIPADPNESIRLFLIPFKNISVEGIDTVALYRGPEIKMSL